NVTCDRSPTWGSCKNLEKPRSRGAGRKRLSAMRTTGAPNRTASGPAPEAPERSLAGRAGRAGVGRSEGVSAQSVSRYSWGTGYVSDTTCRRSAAAVEEPTSRPNRAAASRRARRTGTIGVLTVGELGHGSAQILTGLSQGAQSLGQTLMHAQVEVGYEAEGWQEEVRRAVDHFLSAPVDGIIVSTSIPGV